MSDVWMTGAEMTCFGVRRETLPDLMAKAALASMSDADRERPDAIVVAVMSPEESGRSRISASPSPASW